MDQDKHFLAGWPSAAIRNQPKSNQEGVSRARQCFALPVGEIYIYIYESLGFQSYPIKRGFLTMLVFLTVMPANSS